MQNLIHELKEQLDEKISTEFRMLLSLFDYDRTTPLQRTDDFSFKTFLKLLRRHRIRPSVLEKIDQFKAVFSTEELEQIKVICTPFLLNQMKLTQASFSIISAFNESGIRVIPFKGQLLSKKLFNSYTFRESQDIDLLIHSEDLLLANAILKRKGFTCELEIQNWKDWHVKWLKRITPDLLYIRKQDKVKVELHWSFFNQSGIYPKKTAEIFLDAQKSNCQIDKIVVLTNEDELLYLCIHGTKHSWFRIKWLLDIRQILINSVSEIDWQKISDISKRNNNYPTLASSLLLVHLLFNIPIPKFFKIDEFSDETIINLTENAIHTLSDENLASDPINNRMKQYKKLNYSFGGLKDYLWTFLLTKDDFKLIKLPPSLFWLYFPLRPFMIIYKKLLGYSANLF